MPTLETVASDLALLDLAAGHFAKVHFLTSSQVSFTFAREVAGLANKAVRRASLAGPRSANRSSDCSPDLLSSNMPGEQVRLEISIDSFRILIPYSASQASVFASSATFEALDTLSPGFFENLSAAGDMIIF